MRDMPDDMSDPPTNAGLDRWFGPEPMLPATTASSSSRPRGKTSWTHPTSTGGCRRQAGTEQQHRRSRAR